MAPDADVLLNMIGKSIVKKDYMQATDHIKEYLEANYDVEMLNARLREKAAPPKIRKLVGGGNTSGNTSTYFSKRR